MTNKSESLRSRPRLAIRAGAIPGIARQAFRAGRWIVPISAWPCRVCFRRHRPFARLSGLAGARHRSLMLYGSTSETALARLFVVRRPVCLISCTHNRGTSASRRLRAKSRRTRPALLRKAARKGCDPCSYGRGPGQRMFAPLTSPPRARAHD
jgi:hypothetical protein